MQLLALIGGVLLLLTGVWGMLTKKNLIRIVIGFSLFDTGIHLVLVSLGYLKGCTAPILDDAVSAKDAVALVVDPVPQAIVLTAIVIGLAITALMLTLALKLYEKRKTLDIDALKEGVND